MINIETIVRNLGLQPADEIIVPKSILNLVQHHAIYMGRDNNGQHFVAENVAGRGVVLTFLSDFLNRADKITRIGKFNGNYYDRNRIVNLAISKVGNPYNLLSFNCEHFTTELLTGQRKSNQVNAGLGIAGVALLAVGLAWALSD